MEQQDKCVVTEAARPMEVSLPPSDADYGGCGGGDARLASDPDNHKTYCCRTRQARKLRSTRRTRLQKEEEVDLLTIGEVGPTNRSREKMEILLQQQQQEKQKQKQDEQHHEEASNCKKHLLQDTIRTQQPRHLSHRIACLIIKLLIVCHVVERGVLLHRPPTITQALASAQPERIKMFAGAAGSGRSQLLGKLLNEEQLLLERGYTTQVGAESPEISGRSSSSPLLPHHRHRRINKHPRHHQKRHYHHHSTPTGDGFSNDAERPLVATNKGLVRGISQKLHTGKFVDAFLGIPFAQPPVGKFRFRHPLPTNPWRDILDASRLPRSCYQVSDTHFGSNFSGTSIWNPNTPLSEDCLYLNVWTPFGVADSTRAHQSPKRAVLVWIYGGCFYSGTSSLAMYDGGVLASEEDIIVVSMNYRVAMLGFLYFGRPEAPGNAGLFDQLLALQWVNDNIEQFGGDPKRVTLFGESAGAVSVAFHLLSPLSRNLFSQAILQSGAATNPWAYMDETEIRANGLQVAAKVGCSGWSSNGTSQASSEQQLDVVVECLLRADPMTLVSTEAGRLKNVINFPFVPVIDGSFLLESPRESLIKSNFKHTRILLGTNSDEGNYFLVYLPEFNVCPSAAAAASSSVASNLPLPPPPLSSTPPSAVAAAAAATDELSPSVPSPVLEEEANFAAQSANPSGTSGASSAAEIEGPIMESANLHYTRDGQQRSGQANQLQFEPNGQPKASCKPIELPSINRSDFINSINQDLNPYAAHPVGKSAIIFEYSNWNNPTDPISNYDAYDKIVGDFHFTCPVRELAQRYADAGNTVYMYYFRHRSSVSAWPKWMGVLHGDEISYIFGEPLNPALKYTAKEIELSKRMMRYWANFARHGNPTKLDENSTMNEKWPEYADRRQYFELNPEYVRLGRGPRAKQCTFWSHYLPKLIDSYDSRSQCMSPSDARPSEQLQMDWRREQQFEQEQRASKGGMDSLLVGGPLSGSSALVGLICVILVLAIVGVVAYGRRTGRFELGFLSQHPNSSSSSSGPSTATNN